jgi:hypothetical protein
MILLYYLPSGRDLSENGKFLFFSCFFWQKSLKISILLLFLIPFITLKGQTWERTFSSSLDVFPYELKEHYDRGFILGAGMAIGNLIKIGWIIKLDVNGNILWDKKLGNGSNFFGLHGIDTALDGGIIMTGVTDTLNNDQWDPFIIKMNNCAEVEWCRIFQTDTKTEFGVRVRTLPDSTYIMLVYDWKEDMSNGTFLYHLTSDGGLIWEQEYFAEDTMVHTEYPRWLEVTPENDFLITGFCYSKDSAQSQLWWLRPMIILADSSGEAIWELAWGDNNPFPEPITGEGFQSVIFNNNYYSCISNYHGPNPDYAPCLIKTSASGVPLYYHDIKENTQFGKASTLDFLNDSILFVGMGYVYISDDTAIFLSVAKIDSLGAVLNEKVINNSGFIPIDAMFTSDQKYLVTALDEENNNYVIKLWKLNLNLQYDSIYTQPLTYDSLCNYPIISETIVFPCDVIMSIVEPAMNTDKVKMLIYPNPAHDVIYIRIPECIQIQSSTQHLTVTTTFHRWYKDLTLQVNDIFGRTILKRIIKPAEKEIEIPVSGWNPGIYCFTLWYNDEVVATEKGLILSPLK